MEICRQSKQFRVSDGLPPDLRPPEFRPVSWDVLLALSWLKHLFGLRKNSCSAGATRDTWKHRAVVDVAAQSGGWT